MAGEGTPPSTRGGGGVSAAEFGAIREELLAFMRDRIYPNEAEFARQCHAARGAGY